MYARVFTSQLNAGKGDEAVAIWREKVAPITKKSKGFKGAYLIGDSETGKGMTITMWETKEDADAMNAVLSQIMPMFKDLWKVPPTPETYEVLLQV
jgi:heme-degrading monooxygenase HmoA